MVIRWCPDLLFVRFLFMVIWVHVSCHRGIYGVLPQNVYSAVRQGLSKQRDFFPMGRQHKRIGNR